MTDTKPKLDTVKKPELPKFQKPAKFQKPNLGGFKNKRFPMPTLSRGVR